MVVAAEEEDCSSTEPTGKLFPLALLKWWVFGPNDPVAESYPARRGGLSRIIEKQSVLSGFFGGQLETITARGSPIVEFLAMRPENVEFQAWEGVFSLDEEVTFNYLTGG